MNKMPFFSICIPVYKNVTYLSRLLSSVACQTFHDYEIVITDDSPDDEIGKWLVHHHHDSRIKYFKNSNALGTPENWNEGIRRASGQWVKLMHDDDWFATPSALQTFFDSVNSKPSCKFHFSAYQNVYETSGKHEVKKMNALDKVILKLSNLHLFRKVYIGNPSCTLISRDIELYYDRHFKFVVDFEYYIRVLKLVEEWHYIDEVLLNIGFNEQQVTVYTKYNPAVQLSENHLLVKQFGESILNNILVYDHYWRMYRNVGVRNLKMAERIDANIPLPLKNMIKQQSKIPLNVLKIGALSKFLMISSFLGNYRKS